VCSLDFYITIVGASYAAKERQCFFSQTSSSIDDNFLYIVMLIRLLSKPLYNQLSMRGNAIAAFCLLFLCNTASSQPSVLDTASEASATAVRTYNKILPVEKAIYTGPEHVSYLPSYEGFAYYLSKEWQSGSVLYDGLLYEGQLLLYDLVKDKLVLKRYDGFAIELRSEKVSYFTIPGHTFIYKNGGNKGVKEGYYELLASGALTMLARHTKTLVERAEDTQVRQYFTEGTAYYAIKDSKAYSIHNLSSALEPVDSGKGAIQKYLKQQGIRFKKDRARALVVIADYYNKNQR
jgi:hypothetical protein